MISIWPFVRLRIAALTLALSCAASLAIAAGASGTPGAVCRDQLCAGAVRVGTTAVTWTSPELFYPNNEDLFAAAYVGPRPLAEVRAYGPALCRHRFVGSRIAIVIKACTPETNLRVRAISTRKNTKLLRISYAARPDMGGDADTPATAASVYAGLTQITGIETEPAPGPGVSSGL